MPDAPRGLDLSAAPVVIESGPTTTVLFRHPNGKRSSNGNQTVWNRPMTQLDLLVVQEHDAAGRVERIDAHDLSTTRMLTLTMAPPHQSHTLVLARAPRTLVMFSTFGLDEVDGRLVFGGSTLPECHVHRIEGFPASRVNPIADEFTAKQGRTIKIVLVMRPL